MNNSQRKRDREPVTIVEKEEFDPVGFLFAAVFCTGFWILVGALLAKACG